MNTNKEIVNESALANAIVTQACEDYRMAIRKRCKTPNKMLDDVLSFFKSEWYKLLTNLDSVILIQKLDKEWEEGQKLIGEGIKVDCPELRKPYEFRCPICGGTAETMVYRFKTRKRKDGSYKLNYYKTFTCKCHIIPEQILLKQEVITNENHQN